MKYVAFIPLRGGSKSIPRKNVLSLAGKPLCQWTIEAAAGAELIDEVYVATDDPEIRRVVTSFAFPKVHVVDRGAHTVTDTASTESAMLEFAESRQFENIVLVQATSPLLRSTDLDDGIRTFERTQADSLVSVVEQKRFIWARGAEGLASPQNYEPQRRPRRQDFEAYHAENGAFYISKREGLIREQSRLFGRMAAHVMAEESFHELDEPTDWTIIEQFLLARESAQARDHGERARQLKVVLTDVDGVLTDSGMYYGEDGNELKKFNTRDAKGLELLRTAGLQVGIVTAENTLLVERRAAKMKLHFLFQGAKDKVQVLERLLAQEGLEWSEIGYIGDDLGDVDLMSRVGFAACPADATAEAMAVAHYRCQKNGGEGCVREFAERILRLRQLV